MRLEEILRNYDRAARYYDRLTDVVFGWILRLERHRAEAVERLGALDGAVVLDVGCGTGRTLPLLIPRVGEGGRVIGLDYSPGMLDRARRRVEKHGWRNAELVRADAVTLGNLEGPFDALIAVWCYGIVYDLEAALARAVEVLRPGGRLAILDFGRSRPDRGLLRWLYPLYSRALRQAGIDTAEDLNDQKLQERWDRGRRFLRARLTDFREDTYIQGAGLILSGRKPSGAGQPGEGIGLSNPPAPG